MKRVLVITLLGVLLLGQSFASKKKEVNVNDFPLTLHITAIDMQQGTRAVTGGGSTDSNGNYSSSVSGGQSYTWRLYTARVDGDPVVYGLSTAAVHISRKGVALALATAGWGAIGSVKSNYVLSIGDYKARRLKSITAFDILFTDKNGKLVSQIFEIESQHVAAATAPAAEPTQALTAPAVPPAVAPVLAPTPTPTTVPSGYQQQNNVRDPATQTMTAQPVGEEGSFGDAARRAKQHKDCLELAKDNPSITCQ